MDFNFTVDPILGAVSPSSLTAIGVDRLLVQLGVGDLPLI